MLQRKYDSEKIKSLLRESYPSEVARILGISRQRIHQIQQQYFPDPGKLARRERDFFERYAMTMEQFREVRDTARSLGLLDPLDSFHKQRANARIRGVPWEMKFGEWWSVWKGKYACRGRGKEKLVMCRRGDVGAYSVGNVFLDTSSSNMRQYWERRWRQEVESAY